jgi:hypothetical protein
MLYSRTVQEMLAMLPRAEQAELLVLIGRAATDHDTETGSTP